VNRNQRGKLSITGGFDRGEIGFRVPLERQRQRRTGLEVTKCGCDGKDVVGDGSAREESDLGSSFSKETLFTQTCFF
ncbi:unnamed protein product, partial [Brassica oleracea]